MAWDRETFGQGVGVEPYGGAEAVSIASTDHTFTQKVRALLVTATGDVVVELADGTNVTIKVAVATNDSRIIDGNGKGLWVTKVVKTGTTATVTYGLY